MRKEYIYIKENFPVFIRDEREKKRKEKNEIKSKYENAPMQEIFPQKRRINVVGHSAIRKKRVIWEKNFNLS